VLDADADRTGLELRLISLSSFHFAMPNINRRYLVRDTEQVDVAPGAFKIKECTVEAGSD
jgi:hypothetical protein